MPTVCKCDLSVIVPVYNLEEYITPLLDSLKAQEVDDYTVEYIFVLNNCTDNSEKVIRESGLDCKIINCEIQGCGPARNAGFAESNGEYIWFMDGDDWLLGTRAIRDALDVAKAYGLRMLRLPFLSDRFGWNYFSMVWQYLFHRDLIEDIRFPRKQPAEDDEFTAAALAKLGLMPWGYLRLPSISYPLYYYNYGRVGSNMYRVAHGEQI